MRISFKDLISDSVKGSSFEDSVNMLKFEVNFDSLTDSMQDANVIVEFKPEEFKNEEGEFFTDSNGRDNILRKPKVPQTTSTLPSLYRD